jgi:hypothetical protein
VKLLIEKGADYKIKSLTHDKQKEKIIVVAARWNHAVIV